MFLVPTSRLQPSQLCTSMAKLRKVQGRRRVFSARSFAPVPIKHLGRNLVLTGGHTRALAAALAGLRKIRVYWEDEELGWDLCRVCVRWCRCAGIRTVFDLREHAVPPGEYERLWYERCRRMQARMRVKRRRGQTMNVG